MVAMNSFVPPIMKNDSFFTTSVTVAMVTQTYLIASRSAPRSLRVVCLMSSKLFSNFSQFYNKWTYPCKALCTCINSIQHHANKLIDIMLPQIMHSVLITWELLKRHWELRIKVNMNLIIWLSWKSYIFHNEIYRIFTFSSSNFFIYLYVKLQYYYNKQTGEQKPKWAF